MGPDLQDSLFAEEMNPFPFSMHTGASKRKGKNKGPQKSKHG
jgi:hypothetical protein